MLTVQEAFLMLKEKEVIKNSETLRRWLRDGKIEGAYLTSKKEGWQIPKEEIEQIISVQEQKKNEKSKEWHEGYQTAVEVYKKKMKKLFVLGMYEERLMIYRNEFQELAKIGHLSSERKKFFQFADTRVFKRGVKTPRNHIECFYLDGWFDYHLTGITLDREDYESVYEKESRLETNALYLLIEYLRKEFIKENNTTN